MKNYFVLFIVLFFFSKDIYCQDNFGKLRIILININDKEFKNNITDTCYAYVFKETCLYKKINITKLIYANTNKALIENKLFYDIELPSNNYIVVIEGLNDFPVLFNNVNINKKKIHFLPINLSKLVNINISKPHILLIDYNDNLKEYEEK